MYTCGEDEVWERVVVVGFPDTNRRRNTTCLEWVGLLTRAKENLGCLLAVLDDIEVIRETLLKLGIGKAYTRRREFEKKLRSIASQTQPQIVQMIKQHEPNQKVQSPTFEGGFWGLVAWYRNRLGTS